jgi:AraC-like DNA-binding protein
MLKGREDSSAIVSPVRKITTADSARIISPPVRSVLTADSVVYEIELKNKVDSAALWVRHSQNAAETLGVFTTPPYKAVWKNGHAANQDQIHLQFGYTLFCSDTLVITSPPMPHRWVLERGKSNPSKKSYLIKETLNADSFTIDCDLSKWKNVNSGQIGNIVNFKLLWSKFKLFFIAEVKTGSVTRDDFIELHLDLYHDRESFSGINHRSVRFNPLSRSNSFVVDLNDGSFALNDSVNVLIAREMEWKRVIDSSGYIIEAMIPFVVLSDKEFPPAKFGFDVSVMSTNETGEKVFYSWSGADQFSRYSPKNWGTARISQAWFALKITFISIIVFTILALILTALHTILHKRKTVQYEKQEARGFSPLTEAVINCIEERFSDENFCMKELLKIVKGTEEEIINAIEQDFHCGFERLLLLRRVKHSQGLMRNPELDIEKISAMCGFDSAKQFTEEYTLQMGINPQISRAAILKDIEEDILDEEAAGF